MAIAYCRLEYVKRSEGGNACRLSSYFVRDRIEFFGTKFQEPTIYNFEWKGKSDYHKILLPSHVSEKFLNPEYLWNSAELVENRKNSQVAAQFCLALPRDREVTFEDCIELVETFSKKHFVSKGLAVQIDFHCDDAQNPHAHLLVTTRNFDDSGKAFNKTKPRNIFASCRKGYVDNAVAWGVEWKHDQNALFAEKGYQLRVDDTAVQPQKHIGPRRMRSPGSSVFEENEILKDLNQLESSDPSKILAKITTHQSVFSFEDIEFYLLKHVPENRQDSVRKEFWGQDEIIHLYTRTNEKKNIFTTKEILEEERRILRIAKRIKDRNLNIKVSSDSYHTFTEQLNSEQAEAFKNTVFGENLVCINGNAGTGKSYLLNALKDAYEDSGFDVRGLGPDYATASVLDEKGFEDSENIHRFLFSYRNHKRYVNPRREVWIVDEASKVSNRSLLELLKVADKEKVKVVLCGDNAQFNPVERGEMFQHFCKKFGSCNLVDIQRQKAKDQRDIAKLWAKGEASKAIDLISSNGDFVWNVSKTASIKDLMKSWALDRSLYQGSQLIVSYKRDEMQVLNDVAHAYRKKCGELGEQDFLCRSYFGAFVVSEGDLIEFRRTDNEIGIRNGSRGVLKEASVEKFVVRITEGEKAKDVAFDPNSYTHYHLGYASTAYKSQGGTYDRCYVMHSPQMRLDGYYVLFSRHVEKVQCFVSKSECKNITVLKKLASRAKRLDSTLDFLSAEDIERKELMMSYLQSTSLVKKAYGYGMKAMSKFDFFQKYRDRKHDSQFFNPLIEKTEKGSVADVTGKEIDNTKIITNRSLVEETENPGRFKLVEHSIKVNPSEISNMVYEGFEKGCVRPLEKNSVDIDREIEGENINIGQLTDDIYKDIRTLEKRLSETKNIKSEKPSYNSPKKESFRELAPSKQEALKEYYSKSQRARELYQVVTLEAESKSVDRNSVALAPEWKKAVAERNEAAYIVEHSLTFRELNQYFNRDTLSYLKDYSVRHLQYLDRQNSSHSSQIENSLKENVEALCYSLFPEGPTSKESGALRFGNKGALKVTISGSYKGTFKDFEKDTGGGMISLVQEVHQMKFPEALRWSESFLCNGPRKLDHQLS